MSIADQNRISALETRLTDLERRHAWLSEKHETLSKLLADLREVERVNVLEGFPAGRAALKAAKRG